MSNNREHYDLLDLLEKDTIFSLFLETIYVGLD